MIRIFLPLICAALGLAATSCSQSEGPFAPTEPSASPQSASHDAASASMASSVHAAQADGAPRDPPSQGNAATGTDPAVPVIAQSSPKSALPSASPGPAADQASSEATSSTDQAVSADQAASAASTADQTPSPPSDQTSPSAPPTTGAAATNRVAERRASTVIGMPVISLDGRSIGRVKDIIFDAQGRATHVVIAYDTEPAAGPEEIPEGKPRSAADGKMAALPWDTAVARINAGKLVLDGTKLQSAPSFTADEWPNLQDPAWSANADAYWRKVAPPPASARRSAEIDSTARLRARPTRDGE